MYSVSKFLRIPQRRRLVLVALDWGRAQDPPVSLGQASILCHLRNQCVDVVANSWSVNSSDFSVDHVYDFVGKNLTPNTDFAIGAYVWNESQTQRILDFLKKTNFPGRIIVGGPQVSYSDKGTLEKCYPQADVFIRGYAEEALAQLIQAADWNAEIPGVHYAAQPDLGLSANVDFEELTSPFLSGTIAPQHFIRWETQRGCPFRCAFCQHKHSNPKMVRRYFAESRVMQEIEWICHNEVIQDIAVMDPVFNSGPIYMQIVEGLTRGGFSGQIALQLRAEMINRLFLDAVQELNKNATVVLEVGLQTIHRKEEILIQRPNNLRKVKNSLRELAERKIHVEITLIFGLPAQTVQSFQETIDFCKNYGVTIFAYPLMLLRGTALHAQKQRLGLVESTDMSTGGSNIPHVISSPSFSFDDWQKMAEMAKDLDNYNSKKQGKMENTLRETMWNQKRI